MSLRTEDELNGMSIREVYGLWKEANEAEKKYISDYMESRVLTVSSSDKLEDINGDFLGEYELAAAIKIAYNNKSGKAPKEVLTLVGAAIKSVEGDRNISSLQKNLRMNALIEAQSVLNSGVSGVSENSKKNGNIIAANLKNKKSDDLLPEEIKDFNDADETGGLDNVDPAVVEQLRREIAKLTNFNKVDGKTIETNDNVLADIIGGLYNERLFDKIKVKLKFAEGEEGKEGYVETSLEQAEQLEEVLKHNAALRATYDALSDKDFYKKYQSYLKIMDEDYDSARKMQGEIIEYFQDKIALNYQRSLILARITTLDSDELLDKVTINRKTGRASYQKDDAHIVKVISDVEEAIRDGKEIEVNPHTVGMDTYDMELENAQVSQALKTKNVLDKAKEKMKFFKTMKQGWKQATKDGGWKRVLGRGFVNVGVFGVSAAAISTGSAALIIPGAVAYAGWTYVNAKMMPVYDHIKAKLRNGDKLSRKERRKYIKENWKANKDEVYAQTRFKKRSNFRVSEGAVVAGVAGVTSFVAGPLWSRLARQGVMLGGKGITLGQTAIAEKKSKEQYLEDGHRRLAQYKEIKALESQKTQDIVTLGAVVAGAAYVDSGAAASVNNAVIGALGLEDKIASLQNLLPSGKNTAGANQAGDEAAPADGDNQSNNGAEQENPEVEKTPEQIEQEAKEARWADNQAKLLQEAGDNHNFGTDPKQFDGYTLKMYNAAGKFSTAQHDAWLQNFADGKIDSRPEGMSPMQYIRAYELLEAFGHDAAGHPDAEVVKAIRMDLNCDDDYVPTPEMNERIKEVLGKVVFENKSRLVIIQKGDCLVEYNEYGHMGYMDAQKCGYKQVVLDDGRTAITKSTLTLNRIKGMEVANIDCDGKTVGISKIVQVRPMPCDNQPVIEERVIETPVIETPIIETPVREPQNFAVAPSNDIHFESEIPGTADEIQIHSSKGNSLQIDRKTATESLLALHSDVADSLKASEDITVEQLKQIDKMLGINGGVDIDKDNPWNSKIKVSGTWKENGVDTDNVSVGTVRMTAQMWHESLNGNYGSHTVAQNIDADKLIENAQNIKYSHSENGQDYYDTGITDKKGNAVRFAVPSPVNINMDAEIVAGETSDGGREYACQTTDGSSVIIKLKGNSVTISDEDGRQGVIIAPQDRAPLTEAINQDLAALPENDINKGGKVDLNPDRNSPQAAYEHSRYPDLVPFGNQEPEPQAAPQNNGNQRDYFQEHFHPGRYGNTPDAAKNTASMDLAMMVRNTTRGGK